MKKRMKAEDSALSSSRLADQGDDFAQMLQAARQGDVEAQFALGWCYYMGEGVGKNVAEAAKWYHKAAEQGYDAAKAALKELNDEHRKTDAQREKAKENTK